LSVERPTANGQKERVKFSIVTPSFRQLTWLKRCVRSVADQGGDVEHIIQDAGTGAELEAWVRAHSTARLFVEQDSGMYDALNRGFDRATGDICAYLNCDEQYLPGTLAHVADTFAAHPEVDLVAGDFLILDANTRLLAFRKVTPLRRAMILTDHLYAFTCALFFRRKVFANGLRFDTRLRTTGDGEWVSRVLAQGHRVAYARRYLSTFTFTGENLGAQAVAHEETARAQAALPLWMRLAGPVLRKVRHVEKLLAAAYSSPPISYEVYVAEDDEKRTSLTCSRPQFRYPGS
jgi:glycosyltransferase involved in cell wall biosynthesis